MADPQQQLCDCARAASSAWQQLLQDWSWAELDAHDEVRRLLVRAVAWAGDVGEARTRVDTRTAQRLMAEATAGEVPAEDAQS